MTRRPRDLHLLVGVAAAFLALWTFALVTGTGRAQEPAGVTGGVEAGAGPGSSVTGGTSAPPSFTPAPPPPPAEAAPPPAAGTGGASGDAGTTAQPAPSAPKRPGGSSGEPQEGGGSIPALKRPGDADPEPSPIAPVYRPEEMRRLKSPGGGPKDARDVSPSYGVAAVLALSGRKAQEQPAQTTPTQTQEGEEPPAAQQGQPTQRGTESVEILPPVAPAPVPRPAPATTYGGDVVRAVAAPLRGLAATGFEPLILAALGSLFLLSGLGLRRIAA
jgi:hypothetical protein